MTDEAKLSEHPKIGVLSPLVAGSYASNLIAGVTTATRASGTRVVAIQTLDLDLGGPQERLSRSAPRGAGDGHLGWPPGTEAVVPRFTLRPAWEQVAGFLVVVNAVEPWYLHALREAGKPVVILSHEVDGFACPVVRADNRSGIAQAVAHLVGHGHRRIAFAGCLAQTDITERLAAYQEALATHGIEADESLIFEAIDNLEGGGAYAARHMIEAGMPSTAVVAATDYNALGIMRAFRAAGLVVPRDQAIVGFDDVPAGATAQPTLSTVHQSFEEIARTGANLLLELIQGVKVADGPHLVPTVFVPRESCGCTAAQAAGDILGPSATGGEPASRRLLRRLERLLIEGEAPTAPQTAALERAVKIIVECLEPAPGDGVPDCLGEAAADLYSVSPRWPTISAVVACLREYQRELGKRLSRGQGAARFQQGITEMAIELSRCITQGEASARAALHDVMSVDHELSVSLLSGTAGDPKSLSWLSHTPARAGCLGLWATDPAAGGDGGRRLDITGAYRRDGQPLSLPAQARMEQFPPDGLLEDLDWAPGELAMVFPTKTPQLDLGLLAVVSPLRPAEESGRDRLFENNALLSVAIEREVITERLRRSNADLATFSHAMAHDLRNPLATISMWAAVARMRAGPGDDAGPVLQVVDQIKDVADYANELVTDLLQYAELDRRISSVEPVDLNQAAARVIATIGSSIAQQGALIETGNLPTVFGRSGELQVVLQNLIENSIKYRGDQPPRIRLDAVRNGGTWKLSCRDNGQGIPPDSREQVFEPFTRGHTSIPGSGLGLATCRRIVEGHGGRIWIAATGNLGTTVAFTLPAGPEPEPRALAAPEAEAPAPASGGDGAGVPSDRSSHAA
ncbi:MAG: substrate-binding domain-containing protein [Candidatus Dormibacteria bacterium]|jgi:signal transduction histidine kinase